MTGGMGTVGASRGGGGGGGAGAGADGRTPKADAQAVIARSHSALICSSGLAPKALEMRVQSPKVMPARSSLMACASFVISSGLGSKTWASKCLAMACMSSVSRSDHPKPTRGLTAN